VEDRLPDIRIKADIPPPEFVRRMSTLAAQNKMYSTEYREEVFEFNGLSYLSLSLQKQSPHVELKGLLVSSPGPPAHVDIEVSATRWNPDPPTYEAYVQAARAIFDPLLRDYNRQHGARVRMCIQSRAQLEPKLPAGAQKLFTSFAGCANKGSLHPLDWQRFYEFIRHCYRCSLNRRSRRITEDDVQRLLVAAGFTEGYAKYIADVFQHGMQLLRPSGVWRFTLSRAEAENQEEGPTS
jgi:hypothetical protein